MTTAVSIYVNKNFQDYLSSAGILHQTTVCYTPQQNGIAERANRTLMEMARCLLMDSGLPHSLWSEAVNTATYLRNRCPTKVLKNCTPFECWFGRKPSVFHLRTFGCKAVALNKKPGRSKLDAKGKMYVFVGYSHKTKGYRLYDNESKTILIARSVIFFEELNSKSAVNSENGIKTNIESNSIDDWFDIEINVENSNEAEQTILQNIETDQSTEVDDESSEDENNNVAAGTKRKKLEEEDVLKRCM